ncbi:MAG: hypothetical protein R2698_00935 [Microthrixaceae bacterium]
MLTLLAAAFTLGHLGGPLGLRTTAGVARTDDWPAQIVVALQMLRIAGLIGCVYGVALSAAVLAAVSTRRPDLERVALSMAPPALRRLIVLTVGIGLLSGGVLHQHSRTTHAPALSRPTTTTTTTAGVRPAPRSPDTHSAASSTTLVESPSAGATRPAEDSVKVAPATPPSTTGRDASEPPAATWTIRPGDHLWRIAHDTLTARLDRPVGEDEVTPYWRLLVEANRHRLLDPANPDLVLPGQVIDLP